MVLVFPSLHEPFFVGTGDAVLFLDVSRLVVFLLQRFAILPPPSYFPVMRCRVLGDDVADIVFCLKGLFSYNIPRFTLKVSSLFFHYMGTEHIPFFSNFWGYFPCFLYWPALFPLKMT